MAFPSQGSNYPDIPSPSKFYTQGRAPVCYGLKLDADSVTEAVNEKDLCKLALTAKECAPGWSVDLVSELMFCTSFKDCKERITTTVDVWENTLKAERTDDPAAPPFPRSYKLPQGWNELEALEGYTKDQWAVESADEEAQSLLVYHALTLSFLSIGLAGWVLILVGTILAFITGEGSGDDVDP
jgi:hypothetical protein